MASDSIRDVLTKAFESAEQPDTDAPATAEVADDSSSTDTVDSTPVEVTDNAGADSAPVAGEQTAPATAAAPAPSTPPPASWNTAERATWAALPPAAQEAVKRREAEHNRVLQTSADARRTTAAYDKLFQPFDDVISQLGASREQAIQAMLPTFAALYTATPAQKAELLANAVFQYGVPVDALAQLLHDGMQQGYRPPQQAPQQLDVAKLVREAIEAERANDPLRQEYSRRQEEAATAAISSLESLDYFQDLREEMADVLQGAKDRGKSMDLYTAYAIACQMNGYTPAANPAAAAEQQARDEQGRFAAARRAASTISGSPKPTAGYKPGSGSIRDELIHNFNKQ